MPKSIQSYHPKLGIGWLTARCKRFWRAGKWHKLLVVVASVLVLWVGVMYAMAQAYIYSQKDKPLVIGTSFIPAYAESLGLEPQETMDALINEVGVRHFRLVSYWDQLEPEQGTYDFTLLDWQFEKAEKANAKVTLALGLRQPRWPECHMPDWARNTAVNPNPSGEAPDDLEQPWEPHLLAYMAQVVNRYKDSPALDSYQVENEFFLRGFGICEDIPGGIRRDRLIAEYELVKKLDPKHKVIITRSNNALGWPVGKPTPDAFGVSIYKRVWDAHLTHRYVEYPFPAWYYGFLAAWQELLLDRDMIIHELQAEAWTPRYQPIEQTTLAEQNKSFNAERFKSRVEYAKGTGMREIYLWSGEYWYYRKQILQDDTVWDTAKTIFAESD